MPLDKLYLSNTPPVDRVLCAGDSARVPQSIPTILHNSFALRTPKQFQEKFLAKFRADEVGDVCVRDPWIVMVGGRLFEKMHAKTGKAAEVKKSVRNDMRRLARLYITFRGLAGEAGDSFNHPRLSFR